MTYFMEYYLDRKFIGTLMCDRINEREIGYFGKEFIDIEQDLILDNKRKIKKGNKVMTIIYPLNLK